MSLTKRMIDQLSDREYEELFGGPDDWPVVPPDSDQDDSERDNS